MSKFNYARQRVRLRARFSVQITPLPPPPPPSPTFILRTKRRGVSPPVPFFSQVDSSFVETAWRHISDEEEGLSVLSLSLIRFFVRIFSGKFSGEMKRIKWRPDLETRRPPQGIRYLHASKDQGFRQGWKIKVSAIQSYSSNTSHIVTRFSETGSCHKRQKPQAPTPQMPVRNRQTRKVANAKGLHRNTNLTQPKLT